MLRFGGRDPGGLGYRPGVGWDMGDPSEEEYGGCIPAGGRPARTTSEARIGESGGEVWGIRGVGVIEI